MATPAQLMQIVSETTGVPLPTVVDIDRRLVKAGLRAKAGRGLSAARMQPIDAARLLTGILASAQSNAAAEAVLRYEATRPDKARSSDGLFAGAASLEELSRLPPRHSFVEALAGLIASASRGAVAPLSGKTPSGSSPKIEVYSFTRATQGRIRISDLPDGATVAVEYAVKAERGRRPAGREKSGTADNGDLEQSRRITERTILAVADLLAEEMDT